MPAFGHVNLLLENWFPTLQREFWKVIGSPMRNDWELAKPLYPTKASSGEFPAEIII